uniref:TSC22 domain family member 3 n=1 Tax=Suricata suricatta TaxID=37032 RepID=A0A673UR10_SURSU
MAQSKTDCRSPVGLDCCNCCLDLAHRSGLQSDNSSGENNNPGSPTVNNFRQLQEKLIFENLNTDKLNTIMRQDSLEPVLRDPCYLINEGICNRNIDQTMLSILLFFHSASGASVVAIDNKIEQAMVSGITVSFPSPDLAAAYVTQGRTEGVGAKAFRQEPEEANHLLPMPLEPLSRVPLEQHLLGHSQSAIAGPHPFLLPLFAAASSYLLGGLQGMELRLLNLSASPHLAGAGVLIGCNCTAVPPQSLGWGQEWGGNRKQSTPPLLPLLPGRGHTPLSCQNGCRGLGPPAVSNHFTVCPPHRAQ